MGFFSENKNVIIIVLIIAVLYILYDPKVFEKCAVQCKVHWDELTQWNNENFVPNVVRLLVLAAIVCLVCCIWKQYKC